MNQYERYVYMLYCTYGLKNNQLQTNKKDNRTDFQRLVDSLERDKTEAISLLFNTNKDREDYKHNKALYFIAGELTAPIRKNENMVNRSLLVLDLDDIKADEQDFIRAISSRLNRFKYLTYPTISHNIKGTRYRLIFDINRPITSAEEYGKLIEIITRDIYENILQQSDYKADTSNKTFSQLQGWYVKTEQNKDSPILIHTEGKPLPVDKLLQSYQEPAQREFKADYSPTHYGAYNKPREWADVMAVLLWGEIHEGERHNFFLKAFRAILFGCGDDMDLLEHYIDLISDFNASRCFPPYTPEELAKEYKEANNFVRRKRGART